MLPLSCTALETLLGKYENKRIFKELHNSLKQILKTNNAHDNIDSVISIYKESIPLLEGESWTSNCDELDIDRLHELYREFERLVALKNGDDRHAFVIVIPVADRPRHLQNCLNSLYDLCRHFNYGGIKNGKYQKLAVIIADDSKLQENIVQIQEIVRQTCHRGIETLYFGLSEQYKEIDSISDNAKMRVTRILGDTSRKPSYHKGASITRNITYLKLNKLINDNKNILFWYVDSDQEFRVKINSGKGDIDLYATNYFYVLNEIFSTTNTCVLTGKVVGDPPVSPSVMAANFLNDVNNFLLRLAETDPEAACQFHDPSLQNGDDASYHDMANLFGFERKDHPFQYRCEITGAHTNADCFVHFSSKVNRFFYGEHPTRKTYYTHEDVISSLKPARTVYTGNYVFKPEGLKYFIPFATLKLRMAGPVLGRVIKSDIKGRFVSANLPMLHNRTVEDIGHSEFRPGVDREHDKVDLSGEFERQFFGDIMLFAVEKLTEIGFPHCSLSEDVILSTLVAIQERIRNEYNLRHADILAKLKSLDSLIKDKEKWWNKTSALDNAIETFNIFIDNIEQNFGQSSTCYKLINSDENCAARRDAITSAVMRYADDTEVWKAVLARNPSGRAW